MKKIRFEYSFLFVILLFIQSDYLFGMEREEQVGVAAANSSVVVVADRCPIVPIRKISQIDTRDINAHDLFLFDIDGTLVHDKDAVRQLIDKDTAKFIRLLQNKGALCIAFTSRRISGMEETKKELKKLEIDFSDVPLKSVKLPSTIEIDVATDQKYQDGIIYTSRKELAESEAYQEKGEVLAKFFGALQKELGAGLRFRKIIFVDDHQSELESVQGVVAAIIAQYKVQEFCLYKLDTEVAERRLKGKTKLYESDKSLNKFPDHLRELRCTGHSTEGSTGVFFLEDPRGNKYTFKCLSDPDLMKEEIVADALYQALGVPVPSFAIYNEKPDLSGASQRCDTMGPYRVAEFIAADKEKTADRELVKEKIKRHFVIDAFMANRDVVVDDFKNIIVDAHGTPYRIDNGGSLRYTSVGRVKHGEDGYDIYKVTELSSLRNHEINPAGAEIYVLPQEKIDRQIRELLAQQDRIFTTIDELAKVLDLNDSEELKSILVHRLKYLEEQMQGMSRIVGAYEKVQVGTSASVLMYTQITAASVGELPAEVSSKSVDTYVLLGKRVNHSPGTEDVWSNLGGKSDVGTGEDDQLFADTAAREVSEESVGLITFTPLQLVDCPSHDLIDESQRLFHRMYLAPYRFVEPEVLQNKVAAVGESHQKEYTKFAWVRVEDGFLKALAEGQDHFVLMTSDGSSITIKLLENFRKMLAQPRVVALLMKIKARKKIENLHTRSVVGQEHQEFAYIWQQRGGHWVRKYSDGREELVVPEQEDIQGRKRAENFMVQAQKRADLMRKIRERRPKELGEAVQSLAEVPRADYPLTQTEGFLSLIMGESESSQMVALSEEGKFKQDAHEQNVDKILRKYPVGTAATDKEFCDTLKAVYKNEQKNKHWFVFYHAADPEVAFLWDLYTEFRNQLQYIHSTDVRALRGWDEFFKGIADVGAFIVASKEESTKQSDDFYNYKDDIDNYKGKYQERGLSVNFALFGSYGTGTSSSYGLFYDSKSVRPPDVTKLLLAFFVKVGVPLSFKNHVLAIKDKYFPDLANGRLLQIFMNEHVVDQMVYLSYARGRLLNPANNNADVPAQRMLGLLRTTPEDFMREIKEKAKWYKDDLSSLQARVFLKPEIMFNPEMVRIISYMRYPLAPEVHKLYQEEMQAMVKQLLSYILVANATSDDAFSMQQPLLRDYKHHYQAVTDKKYREGELAGVMAVKHYIDVGNLAGLEQYIETNPKVLHELLPDLIYSKDVPQGAKDAVTPFSYALRHNKADMVVTLIKKGKGFDAAINAATEGVFEDSMQQGALVLWDGLFEWSKSMINNNPPKGINEAMVVVIKGSQCWRANKKAYELWMILFERLKSIIRDNPLQGINEAIDVVIKTIQELENRAYFELRVREGALGLWRESVEQLKRMLKKNPPQGVDETIDAAMKGMMISALQNEVLVLCRELVEQLGKINMGNQTKVVTMATDTVVKVIESGVYKYQDRALDLWRASVSCLEIMIEDNQTQIVDGAIYAITKGIISKNDEVQKGALDLGKKLVEYLKRRSPENQAQIITAVVDVVIGGIASRDSDVQKNAIELWKTLIELDKTGVITQVFTTVLKLDENALCDYLRPLFIVLSKIDYTNRLETLAEVFTVIKTVWDKARSMQVGNVSDIVYRLCGWVHEQLSLKLVKMIDSNAQQTITLAKIEAKRGASDQIPAFDISGALALYIRLIDFNDPEVIAEALAAARHSVDHYENNIVLSALDVYVELINPDKQERIADKPEIMTEVLALARRKISHYDSAIRSKVHQLYFNLINFNKSEVMTKLLAAAKSLMFSDNEYARSEAYSLYAELIALDNPDVIAAVFVVANAGMTSGNKYTQQVALQLYGKLFSVKQQQTITKARAVAKIGIASKENEVQKEALTLYRQLIDSNEPEIVTEAFAAAKIGIGSSDSKVKKETNRLVTELLYKLNDIVRAGGTADEAMDAIMNFVKIEDGEVQRSIWFFFRGNSSLKGKAQEIAKQRLSSSEQEKLIRCMA